MNETLDLMAAHRSVRRFQDTPVPAEHIRAAVSAARQASTSSWIQAYHLLQVTDPETRAQLAELAGGQAQVKDAPAFFVLSGDARRHAKIAEWGDHPHEQNLESFLQIVIDASLFAQNLTLAFESLGYGICMIGGLRNELPEADRLIGLPSGVWPLFGLCIGIPDGETERRSRLPVEALWSVDTYPSDDKVREQVEAFDAKTGAEYEARGLTGRNWSGGVWRKFSKRFRQHLKAFYEGKGASVQ